MTIPPTHFEDWQSWSEQKGVEAELTKHTGTAPDRVSAGHLTRPGNNEQPPTIHPTYCRGFYFGAN